MRARSRSVHRLLLLASSARLNDAGLASKHASMLPGLRPTPLQVIRLSSAASARAIAAANFGSVLMTGRFVSEFLASSVHALLPAHASAGVFRTAK
jgi:hypothetical protein